MAVGNGNSSGSHDGINKAILAVPHGNMVNPNVARTIDGNAITITLSPQAIMELRISDHATPMSLNVEDLNSMDDNILDKLNGNTSTTHNVDINPSSINCLVASHDELLLESDDHAACKCDPQRPVSRDGVPESAGF